MNQLKWVHYAKDQRDQGFWRLMEYDKPDDDYYRRCIAVVERYGISTSYWAIRFVQTGKVFKPFQTADDAKAWALAEVRLS